MPLRTKQKNDHFSFLLCVWEPNQRGTDHIDQECLGSLHCTLSGSVHCPEVKP